MYCFNCGKLIKEDDNFCRYCGCNLKRDEIIHPNIETNIKDEVKKEEQACDSETQADEEFVLYDVKKHWMSLFWSAFFTPIFFLYFWNIFLNTHSFLSWIIVFAIAAIIVYPILRYNSDKIIITNKFVHIKIWGINPTEKDIPLENIDILDISQTSFGNLLGYGLVTFCLDSQKYDWGYIQSPEDLEYIVENPKQFVNDSLDNA